MYSGPWINLHKPPHSRLRTSKGLPLVTMIHDDETAQTLGYKGGFVGGLTLFGVAFTAIAASLGHPWFECGVCSIRHRAPTYEGDERVVWQKTSPNHGDTKRLDFWLENRDGARAAPGWAAIGQPGQNILPPWEREPAHRISVGEDALPEIQVGQVRRFPARIAMVDALARLNTINEQNLWFRVASPWGDPILCPLDVAYMRHQDRNQPLPEHARLRTTMDAGIDMIFYSPMFPERNYQISVTVVDKWQTERSVFFCSEYTYDDESGRRVAAMRAYAAHLIRDLLPF